MSTDTKLKYDLTPGTKFIADGEVWIAQSGTSTQFAARRLTPSVWRARFSKVSGQAIKPNGWNHWKPFAIESTDAAAIADVERRHETKLEAERQKVEEREKERAAFEVTDLYQLAKRICDADQSWDFAATWTELGMDTLKIIEQRLIEIGKLTNPRGH